MRVPYTSPYTSPYNPPIAPPSFLLSNAKQRACLAVPQRCLAVGRAGGEGRPGNHGMERLSGSIKQSVRGETIAGHQETSRLVRGRCDILLSPATRDRVNVSQPSSSAPQQWGVFSRVIIVHPALWTEEPLEVISWWFYLVLWLCTLVSNACNVSHLLRRMAWMGSVGASCVCMEPVHEMRPPLARLFLPERGVAGLSTEQLLKFREK